LRSFIVSGAALLIPREKGTIHTLPAWRGHTVRLRIHSRGWFCDVPDCPRQIFADRFDSVLAH